MNAEEQENLRQEISSKYKKQIEVNKEPDDEVQFVFDDKEIDNLSKDCGWINLGVVGKYWVRLIRTAKRLVYILVLSTLAYEGMKFAIPEPAHLNQIYGEYSDIATWEARIAKRQEALPTYTLSFTIEKQQPHVPENDQTTFPTATTLNIPITGLSPELFKFYSGRG
jgi:hypothetical protein